MSVTWQNMHIAHASIDTIWYYLIPYMRSTSSPACASQLENRIPMNGSIISIKLASTPLHPSSSKRGQLVTEHSHIPHSLPILFQVYSHDIPMIFPWYSHDIPMIIPWYSHDIPMIFPWYSHDIPIFPPSVSQLESHQPTPAGLFTSTVCHCRCTTQLTWKTFFFVAMDMRDRTLRLEMLEI